ncbi:hypothetical protein H2200_005830 [Cladophialophora chaetospira]|uniref:Uncharacterized protein n=1 Tax=Cladophialophora chaetospira TaxID=386627 RepID=A0AA38X9W5_9EURO|nr:hypothetical protein H2200_005830 [Cladophialophora chaetospira]
MSSGRLSSTWDDNYVIATLGAWQYSLYNATHLSSYKNGAFKDLITDKTPALESVEIILASNLLLPDERALFTRIQAYLLSAINRGPRIPSEQTLHVPFGDMISRDEDSRGVLLTWDDGVEILGRMIRERRERREMAKVAAGISVPGTNGEKKDTSAKDTTDTTSAKDEQEIDAHLGDGTTKAQAGQYILSLLLFGPRILTISGLQDPTGYPRRLEVWLPNDSDIFSSGTLVKTNKAVKKPDEGEN